MDDGADPALPPKSTNDVLTEMVEPTAAAEPPLGPTPGSPDKTTSGQPQVRPRGDRLLEEIRLSTEALVERQTTRGDLKLIGRSMRELSDALNVFTPYRRTMKVTIFGSARTPPEEPAYQQAMLLGERMAKENWLVITGAASGIMEAGHRGAGREHSMGVNIMLPFEQSANPVIAGDAKLVNMRYFFTRKLIFVKECQAVVLLPGGFGTLDEGFEVLTLLQTGKRDLLPVVLLDEPGGGYWSAFQEFVKAQLLKQKLISEEDLHLYLCTDSIDAAVSEILNFYRNFHSMRYVREELVLRLRHSPSDAMLSDLQRDFGDLLTSGGFRRTEPLSGERDEPELAHLPRLAFRFNRRNHGRLRVMINRLNAPSE